MGDKEAGFSRSARSVHDVDVGRVAGVKDAVLQIFQHCTHL